MGFRILSFNNIKTKNTLLNLQTHIFEQREWNFLIDITISRYKHHRELVSTVKQKVDEKKT